ncbi:hypothetical protein SLE2022_327980 [Rubroshorea leprosula]
MNKISSRRGRNEPFQDDFEREKHYAEVLRMNMIDTVDPAPVEAEMIAAFKAYDLIVADLGIIHKSCRSFGDPCQLTRWIVGEEKLQKV